MSRNRILTTLLTIALLMTWAVAQQEITIWSGYPELEPFYTRVAEDFMADNPDVRVTVLTQPLREYERRLNLALPSGTGPDLVELSSSYAQRLIEGGILPPAPDSIEELVRSGIFTDFYVEQATVDGEVYGLPLFRGQATLYYNTEMLEEAGLSGPPTSMDEFVEYARALTVQDENGEPIRSGWSLRLGGGGSGIAQKWAQILYQYGGEIVEQTPNGGWRAAYADEAGQQTLQLYVDLVNKYNTITPELPGDAEGFERETTAMFIRESWVIGDIAAKAPNLPYETAYLPRGTSVVPVNIYVNSDEPAVAEYATYMVKPEHMLWMFENVGWLPNRSDVDYSPVVERIPQAEAFLEIPENYELFAFPSISALAEIETRLAEHLVPAFTNPNLVDNPEGIRQVLEEAAEETNEILRRAGLYSEQ